MSKRNSLPFEVTLKVRDSCLGLHIQRAARAVARRFDAALRPLRLSNRQFSLLMSLNRPEPPTLGNVSSVLAMDHATLSVNLKPLERRGLLKVETDEADRRTRRAMLTPAGRALLIAALPIWERTNKEVERLLIRTHPNDFRADLRELSQPAETERE